MKKIIIHILDRKFIYFINNTPVIVNTDLYFGKINQEDEFLVEIQRRNKEYKVNHKIIGDEVIIIINDFYTNQDIKYLKQIFIELQFHKITFVKESKFFHNEVNTHILVDEDSTRIFIPQEKPILISSLIANNQILETIVNKYRIINNINLLNYTDYIKITFNESLKIYTYTNPYNFLADKLVHE